MKMFDWTQWKTRFPWTGEKGETSTSANAAPRNGGSAAKTLTAGPLTGAVEISITYPTEFIKTHLQLDEEGPSKRYAGMVDCAKKTVKDGGVLGLYRGFSVLFVGSIPRSAIRFGCYEGLRSWASDGSGDITVTKRGLCGVGAGVMEGLVVTTPMETVKVKFISDQREATPRFRGLLHGLKVILKEEGLRGIYRGTTPTVLRQASSQGVRFTIVEACKDHYKRGEPSAPVPKLAVGVFGTVAGAASVLVNTPVDVIKTRLQGQDANRYKGTVDCARQTWKNEGFAAFYKGTIPRLTRNCLEGAITFMVFDGIAEWLNQSW